NLNGACNGARSWLPCAYTLVSRTRCSLGDAKHRPATLRRRAGTCGCASAKRLGPGSAAQRFAPHCVQGTRAAALEYSLAICALLPFRALPDHAGITFQRHQRLAGVGPFLQFLDGDVIE